MNKYLAYLLVSFLFVNYSFSQNNFKTFIKTNDYGHDSNLIGIKFKNFSFSSFNKEITSLTQLNGKILIINFWETWCNQCIRSIPELNRISKNYKNKNVEVLGITTENKEKVKDLIERKKPEYKNIYATPEILNEYGISSRPTYLILNEESEIIFVSYGNLKIVENKLKEIINKKSG